MTAPEDIGPDCVECSILSSTAASSFSVSSFRNNEAGKDVLL